MTNQLSVFRGRDYVINEKITVRQPTVGEVEEYGERDYFSLVKMLTSTPADRKVDIWDSLHTYWEKIDEFELFVSTFKVFQTVDTSILLPNLDFKSFGIMMNPNTKEMMLVNQNGVKIDRAIYTLLTDYLRSVHQFKKNRETGYDDFARDLMIDEDRYERAKAANKPFQSVLLPFASYLSVRNGFSSVWEIPIGAFLHQMQGEQKLKNYENLMHGIYSGCVDIKKINKSDLTWL